MAKGGDPAGELAAKLIQVLEAQRGLGGDAYPLPLGRLAALTDVEATQTQVFQAVRKKTFTERAILARAKSWEAPAALRDDLELLAGSPSVLEFLLQTLTTPSNQAFSASELGKKVTSKLQRPFQAAVTRQIEDGTLPATVGWITINRSRRLFLWAVLHANRKAPAMSEIPPVKPTVLEVQPATIEPVRPAPPAATPREFASAFEAVFHRLNREQGSHNFVSLVDLRKAVPVERAVFDNGLNELRLAGRYGLSAAEGRHGITAEQQEAGIVEDGTLLLYVSRKLP